VKKKCSKQNKRGGKETPAFHVEKGRAAEKKKKKEWHKQKRRVNAEERATLSFEKTKALPGTQQSKTKPKNKKNSMRVASITGKREKKWECRFIQESFSGGGELKRRACSRRSGKKKGGRSAV